MMNLAPHAWLVSPLFFAFFKLSFSLALFSMAFFLSFDFSVIPVTQA